jgi:hypothetical protein
MNYRQEDKTTLARDPFHDHIHVKVLNPELHSLALEDPNTFMLRFPILVILDEIQNVPE